MAELSGFKFNDGDGTFFDLDDIFVRKDVFFTGAVWSWGYNLSGQLGDGTTINKSSPVQIAPNSFIIDQECPDRTLWKQISAGGNHVLGIHSNGGLYAWGCGSSGQRGTASTVSDCYPTRITAPGISGFVKYKQVSAGKNSSAAIRWDATLWTWGENLYGQLGNSSTLDTSCPIQVSGNNWKSVSFGGSHVGAIKTDGSLWLWGDNQFGQLGNNSTVTSFSSPVQTVAGGTNWKQVSAGAVHTAAIKTDGSLWLWGRNCCGELGINSTNLSCRSPVQTVAEGTNWKQVSAGGFNTAAIKTDGSLWIWGDNLCGQIGDNSVTNKSSPVQTIDGSYNWKQVNISCYFTTGLKTDGSLWTWGSNCCGVLGTGSTVNRSSPAQTIVGGNDWVQVSSSSSATVPFVSALRNYWE